MKLLVCEGFSETELGSKLLVNTINETGYFLNVHLNVHGNLSTDTTSGKTAPATTTHESTKHSVIDITFKWSKWTRSRHSNENSHLMTQMLCRSCYRAFVYFVQCKKY